LSSCPPLLFYPPPPPLNDRWEEGGGKGKHRRMKCRRWTKSSVAKYPPDGNGQSNPSPPPPARWSVRGSRGKGRNAFFAVPVTIEPEWSIDKQKWPGVTCNIEGEHLNMVCVRFGAIGLYAIAFPMLCIRQVIGYPVDGLKDPLCLSQHMCLSTNFVPDARCFGFLLSVAKPAGVAYFSLHFPRCTLAGRVHMWGDGCVFQCTGKILAMGAHQHKHA
jgi:hypothetical protein